MPGPRAGVASVLPAASVARTSKVWLLSVSPATVCGLVQAANDPPSMLHSNVEPGSLDVEREGRNRNVGRI